MNSLRQNRRGLRTSLIAGAVAILGLGGSALACDPADFNMSGHVGLEDLAGYLTAYLAGDKSADINLDGKVSVQDLFDFIGYWVPSYIESSQVKPAETVAEPTSQDQLPEDRIDTDRNL
jgi:histidine ammonia-lyase